MKKILLIEDNVEIAELLCDVMESEGMTVTVCHDAKQGVALALGEKPDLMVLDLMLPEGGGFAVLEKVKQAPETKDIPVLVLTASKDDDHKARAIAMGVDAYLSKPYDPRKLIQTIRGFVG